MTTQNKVAEYFDSDKFESSASRIWKVDHFGGGSKWNTSLYFVPESDIAHFHFNFELRRTASHQAAIIVTRERSLAQGDLVYKRKDAKLMIQLLLIDSSDKQINLKKFVLNLFEKDRDQYDRFRKEIPIDSRYLEDKSVLVDDVLKIRIGGGILKNQISIPEAESIADTDYIAGQGARTIPQLMDFASQKWSIEKFSKLKLSESILAVTAPMLGVKTNLHLDLYRHEDTNRLTIGIRRERFFIKDDVLDQFKQMKVQLNFSFLDAVTGQKCHFQEIVMSFFENERSNYGNHVKEFIIEEDVLTDGERALLVNDQVQILIEAAVLN